MRIGFPQMSLFGRRHLGEAVDHGYERGIILAGAGGQVIDRVTYPGKFSRTIGVGDVRDDRTGSWTSTPCWMPNRRRWTT